MIDLLSDPVRDADLTLFGIPILEVDNMTWRDRPILIDQPMALIMGVRPRILVGDLDYFKRWMDAINETRDQTKRILARELEWLAQNGRQPLS